MNDRFLGLDTLIAEMLGARPGAWISGEIAPPSGGRYERLTPSLGVTVDVWDVEYCCWRRAGHRTDPDRRSPFSGVICANQDLPWRVLRGEVING